MAFGDDDLDACFSTDEFGVAAVFTTVPANPPTPATTISVNGYFTEVTETVNLLDGEPIAFDKSFACPTATIATVRREHTVVINAVTYTVKKKMDLGTGVSLVLLKT